MIAETCLAIGLHLVSAHSVPGYNGVNPGVYCRTPSNLVLGTYYNSVRRQTFYAGRYIELGHHGPWEAGVVLGLATGYKGPITPLPMVVGTLSYSLTPKDAIRLSFAPKFRVNGAAVVNLAVEHRF